MAKTVLCVVWNHSVVWDLDPSPEQMHRLWAHYGANVTMIDEKLGENLDARRRPQLSRQRHRFLRLRRRRLHGRARAHPEMGDV